MLLISGGPVVLGSFTIPIEPERRLDYAADQYRAAQQQLRRVAGRSGFAGDAARSSIQQQRDRQLHRACQRNGHQHLCAASGRPERRSAAGSAALHDPASGVSQVSGHGDAQTNLVRDPQEILGRSYNIPLDQPLTVEQGGRYYFKVDLVSGGAVMSGGSVFTWEGAWDDPVPTGVCALPDWHDASRTIRRPGLYMDRRDCNRYLDVWDGLVNGYQQNIVYEDEPAKRDHLLLTLDNSDYLAISSNRFYDSLSRNPMRWPLTNFYYQKLFAGELGYDLVATFQETFELGPLQVSDQYLPTYTRAEMAERVRVGRSLQRLRSSGRLHLQEARRLRHAESPRSAQQRAADARRQQPDLSPTVRIRRATTAIRRLSTWRRSVRIKRRKRRPTLQFTQPMRANAVQQRHVDRIASTSRASSIPIRWWRSSSGG